MFYFQSFNCTIASEINFPELTACQSLLVAADIQIKLGQVPDQLANPLKSGAFFQSNDEHFRLKIPAVGRFLVSKGKHIVVEPEKTADEASIRIFILDACFKALLNQRQFAVFEGCAIQKNSQSVLFLAAPGFGKSTLSALFLKRGYRLISEEICAIDSQLSLLPGFPIVNLWSSISEQLLMDRSQLKTTRLPVERYRVELNELPVDSLAIKLIYILGYHKSPALAIRAISNDDKLEALTGSFIPPYIRIQKAIFQSITNDIPMVKLNCPRWDYPMNQLGYLLGSLMNDLEADLMKRIAND